MHMHDRYFTETRGGGRCGHTVWTRDRCGEAMVAPSTIRPSMVDSHQLNHSGPFGTIRDHSGPFGTILNSKCHWKCEA